MGRFIVYEVENVKTGEKITGTSVEISERLGVTRAYISKQLSNCGLISSEWKVNKLDEKADYEKSNNGSIPPSLKEEWDKFTAPFKKLSAKKASRA